jgi:hypothetical protein
MPPYDVDTCRPMTSTSRPRRLMSSVSHVLVVPRPQAWKAPPRPAIRQPAISRIQRPSVRSKFETALSRRSGSTA